MSTLFEKFKKYVTETCKRPEETKVLLAVSGGIDSMVMLHLFKTLDWSCEVAHCNFQLRGAESDLDEAFVREQAASLGFSSFVVRFETLDYATEQKISIQMAARELRYTWFNRLAKAHKSDCVAIAHNQNDAIETFFINLGRGTGIDGLKGIRPVTGNLIRPLLFCSRSDIEKYASEHHVPFREDSSNLSDKYQRNFIRHHIIPQLSEVFPGFGQTMERNLDYLNDASTLYHAQLEYQFEQIITTQDKEVHIDISKLLNSPAPKTVLYEFLRRFGFSSLEMDDIIGAVHAISGKQFFSSTHQLLKDRNCFILTLLNTQPSAQYYIESTVDLIDTPLKMIFERIERTECWKMEPNLSVAFLDFSKLEFPLIIRKWQNGDYFIPLGMSGMKKISDFFIDVKMPLTEKENTWLLISGNQIVWVIGKRIDNRFKISDSTLEILKISITI